MTSSNKLSLFNVFKEQLQKKGFDFNVGTDVAEKSAIIDKLRDDAEGPTPITCKHGNSHSNHTSHGRSLSRNDDETPVEPTQKPSF